MFCKHVNTNQEKKDVQIFFLTIFIKRTILHRFEMLTSYSDEFAMYLKPFCNKKLFKKSK